MPDIRCSHCGRDNPDFLDVCQFCQSPLKSESMLHIGQKPTKKTTGELEGVLPDWLKTARQQSRDSAEEDAAFAAAQPKSPKEEPPDLLAGLFQSQSSDEEEIPDWLSNINPTAKSKPAAPLSSAAPKPETDFFAQFNQSQPSQAEPLRPDTDPVQPSQTAAGHDELSEWFIQASEEPLKPSIPEMGVPHSDWGTGDETAYQAEDTPAPKEEEDLSWLHNLESAAKQTDELRSPKQPEWRQDSGASSSASGEDDLSWLNNLGGISAPEQPITPPAQPSQPQEDLSWLNKLGAVSPEPAAQQPARPQEDLDWLNAFGTETPKSPQPAQPAAQEDLSWLDQFNAAPTEQPSQPESPQEDLSWLNSFGASPEPSAQASSPSASAEDLDWLNKLGATPAETPSSSTTPPQEDLSWLNAFGAETPQPTPPAADQPASQEDLSWLNAFSAAPESSQPASQEDLSWLNSLQGEPDTLSSAPFADPAADETTNADMPHVSPFMPRKTAPLDETAAATDMPDWLKSATEEPSMPMGTSALDQFREDYKIPSTPEEPFSWKSFTQEAKPVEPSTPPQQQPAFTDFFGTSGETSSVPSAEDVNSVFSMEMPDWLSQAEPTKQEEPSQPIGIHAEGGEALAPVDLPSWVQAMRPVDAVIAESTSSIDDQPTEREGPLAGFKGLIPAVPLGSARRPKAISLKLQVSDEQQASAAILEQLLAGETSPRPLVSTPAFASQRALRWVLAGLFILVLGAIIGLRSQMFAASAVLPAEARALTNIISGLPEGANVLIVVDYEPALAGEMEAVSGPLLDQLATMRHPKLSFLSTSPNGSALVDRLLTSGNLTALGYGAGQNYSNLGYLAGAESGVLAFIQSPRVAVPSATVNAFSEYSAVILLTDNAESSKTWIEQLQTAKQRDASMGLQPLLVASSAQAGPLLQPYALSRQVNGLISGLADASRFEFVNNSQPGLARSYLDAFGVGLLMAVGLIGIGSLWSIVAGMRSRRAEAAEG